MAREKKIMWMSGGILAGPFICVPPALPSEIDRSSVPVPVLLQVESGLSQPISRRIRSHLLAIISRSPRSFSIGLGLLGDAERECGVVPTRSKGNPWVEYGQAQACQDDHDTVENHELGLLVGQLAREPLAQLDGSEDGSREQEARCGEECFDFPSCQLPGQGQEVMLDGY